MALATRIASLSPVAVQGTKQNLVWSRDRPVGDGLQYMATWNAGMLQTTDIPASAEGIITGKAPKYNDL